MQILPYNDNIQKFIRGFFIIKNFKIMLIIIIASIFMMGCGNLEVLPVENSEDSLEIHFIDVGQGDAILIIGPNGENLLIDAGTNSNTDNLLSYIQKQGVKSFTAVVATHPHEDHIGGLDKVIDKFDVQNVYMPRVTHTTKTFEDVLDAIERKGLRIKSIASGVRIPISFGDAMFLAPVSEGYEDLNNYSGVLRLQYGDHAYLFTGDAETLSENEMISEHPPELLSAKVLKVGHHGSSSSTSKEFLDAVKPVYAVISLGEDNSYGHPHVEVLERLENSGAKVFRTDLDGTIILKSDGKEIELLKEGK